MKHTLKTMLCAVALLGSTTAMAQEQLLAFPGAEGFGRYTQGARAVAKPEVYHVTNLNDAGAGSLRDAVSKEGRVIVFDVAGTINLESPLVFKGNNTVLGQTAPGEGINIYGNRTSFSGANNLIVRYLRFREGINGPTNTDACGVANGMDMIFDHLSVLWGKDENFSVSWDNKNNRPANITIQNTIIGQGLQTHSCGGLIQTIGGVTLYRNLYIENKTRNPKVKGLNQYVNNVVYNWGEGGCYIMSDSEGDSWADIENNYFVKGPWKGTNPFSRGIQSFRYYGVGNYYDDNASWYLDGHEMSVEEMNGSQNGTAPYSTYFESLDALNANITEYNATATETIQLIPEISNKMTAEQAYLWMIEGVGPSIVRDVIDEYIIDLIKTNGKKGSINGITSEKDLPHKGIANLSGGVKPLDTDGDGMPDAWETANGLNPNDASDATAVAANGYLNIENYANGITEAFPYIKKPLNLAVTAQGKTSLSLSWDVNNNTTNGFVIETSTDGKNFTETATAAAGATSIELTDLAPATEYWVRVRATDGKGLYSDYTETVATETINDPSAPYPSVNPTPAVGAKEGVAAGITFKWEDNKKAYGGTVTYTLYLGEAADALSAVASDLKVCEWSTETLEAGKTYYWRVDSRNDIGTTTGTVWNFSTTAGGVLFYADFNTLPAAWGAKYADITANTNVFNAANQKVDFDGMTVGCGANAIRVVALSGNNNSSDLSADYGPASDNDRGASNRAIQFVTEKEGGYVETPEVQGPCVLTMYLGNTSASARTVKIITVAGGNETTESFTLGNTKRIYKYTKTYPNAGAVKFRLDANGKKINVNDILIERYVAPEGDEPLEMTTGTLSNEISYADGSINLGFNQEISYKGGATVKGVKMFESIVPSASGQNLTISYEGLDINSEYVISFPEGAVTNVDGTKSFVGDVKLITCDYSRAVASGDKHFGKAAKELPINFAPFTTVAPFATVGDIVQTSQNDYPHWVQVSPSAEPAGKIEDNCVTITTKNDKVMGYWDGVAKQVHVEVDVIEGTSARIYVQESRNPDLAPTWRTIRVLTPADLPFSGEFDLNPESRFIKVSAPTISGSVLLKSLRISDASGNFGAGFSGIDDIVTDDNAPVEYFNLQGIRVDNPTQGLYIRRQGTRTEKVVIR